MRRFACLAATVACCALAPSALGDGLPVLGVDVGSTGVTVPGGPNRYVTVSQGNMTLVESIARNGGRILGIGRVRGSFTIPAVAYDASASGLSADGKTLVLIEPRVSFPRQVTRFVLLDTRKLRVRRAITLRGDFSFDAVSPHGTTMFLVNYTSPGDPTRYTVRAYDLQAGELLPDAIRDPAERSERMRGSPITRLQSADGRWAYTLYSRPQGAPFIHALDTRAGTAACIDLDGVSDPNEAGLRLIAPRGGGPLVVAGAAGPVKLIDRRTFAVSDPSAPPKRTPPPAASRDGGGPPWGAGAALLAAIALLGLTARAARARSAA
jgi:hypothetical protein